MPLYDPYNPVYADPPDLRGLIDRYAEGDMRLDGDAGEYDDPYQGVTEDYGDSVNRAGEGYGHDTSTPNYKNEPNVFNPDGSITGRAATFADAGDLRRYAAGGGLKYGDNGVGYYGHKTSGDRPFVAVSRTLLRKVYGHENLGKGQFVEVTSPNGTRGVFEIGDVGPTIKSDRQPLIELNPGARRVLGSGDASGYTYRLLPRQ